MSESEKSTVNEIMFSKLADGLDSTSRLTRALLSEIRESEADFATIKTELAILRDNVKSLSIIVKEGNGSTSLLTKIALIEQKLNVMDKWIDDQNDTNQKYKTKQHSLKSEIEDLQRRVTSLEKNVQAYISKVEEKEKQEQEYMRVSIHRAEELEAEKKKANEIIKKEKVTLWLKIIGAVIIAVITAGIAIFKS